MNTSKASASVCVVVVGLLAGTAAAVGIKASTTEATQPSGTLLSAEEVYSLASKAVVKIEVRDGGFQSVGLGSGFFISKDGLLVTNYHVIKGACFAAITGADQKVKFARGIVATDLDADLAILKLDEINADSLSLTDAVAPNIGARVYAIGNPQGLTNSLSEGIVSAYRVRDRGVPEIQFTAPISPGSSGGPLLDTRGRVIGVTTSYRPGGQNLNFAVSASRIKHLIAKGGAVVPLPQASLPQNARPEAFDGIWEAIQKEQYGAALKALAHLPEDEKYSSLYWQACAYVYYRLGNMDLAIGACDSGRRADPKNVFLYQIEALCLSSSGRPEDAIDRLKSSLLIDPGNSYSYAFMGMAYIKMSAPDKALGSFKTAASIDPTNETARRNLGLILKAQGQLEEAIHELRKALELNPDSLESYKALADACYGQAFQYQTRASETNGSTKECNELMHRHYALKQEEIQARKSALALGCRESKNVMLIGLAYSDLADRDGPEKTQLALEAYQNALLLSRPRMEDMSSCYRAMGSACAEMAQYNDAIKYFRLSLQYEPKANPASRQLHDCELIMKHDLRFDVPMGWIMRQDFVLRKLGSIATYRLPGSSDYFDWPEVQVMALNVNTIVCPKSLDDDIDRWATMFKVDPRSVKPDKSSVGTLNVAFFEVSGDYVGIQQGVIPPLRDHVVLAAFVNGDGGAWAIEVEGPSSIVKPQRDPFKRMLKTLRVPAQEHPSQGLERNVRTKTASGGEQSGSR